MKSKGKGCASLKLFLADRRTHAAEAEVSLQGGHTILIAESVHHTRKDYLKQMRIRCLLDVR